MGQFYWQRWKERFWMYHVAFFTIVFFGTLRQWPPQSFGRIIASVSCALVALLFLIVFPQIMFKSKTRTLVVNEQGIYTTIGQETSHSNWADVDKVGQTLDLIFIVKKRTQNAFIVPRRAFQSDEQRNKFLKAIKDWHWKAACEPTASSRVGTGSV